MAWNFHAIYAAVEAALEAADDAISSISSFNEILFQTSQEMSYVVSSEMYTVGYELKQKQDKMIFTVFPCFYKYKTPETIGRRKKYLVIELLH